MSRKAPMRSSVKQLPSHASLRHIVVEVSEFKPKGTEAEAKTTQSLISWASRAQVIKREMMEEAIPNRSNRVNAASVSGLGQVRPLFVVHDHPSSSSPSFSSSGYIHPMGGPIGTLFFLGGPGERVEKKRASSFPALVSRVGIGREERRDEAAEAAEAVEEEDEGDDVGSGRCFRYSFYRGTVPTLRMRSRGLTANKSVNYKGSTTVLHADMHASMTLFFPAAGHPVQSQLTKEVRAHATCDKHRWTKHGRITK
ncbi:hypothetical protein BGZ63DRAFT_443543 [Mariannaea sp. PMI_226]|nr:hypothetical protein BGZ63DRAFT_443543 [Mariannaea sp. PMI_226]